MHLSLLVTARPGSGEEVYGPGGKPITKSWSIVISTLLGIGAACRPVNSAVKYTLHSLLFKIHKYWDTADVDFDTNIGIERIVYVGFL